MRDIATTFYKNLLTTQQISGQQQKRKIVLDFLEHKVSNEMVESLMKEISSAGKSCLGGCWEECFPRK